MDHYFSIDQEGTAEYTEKGSRFLAIAFPISGVEDFKARLQEIKKQHPKAVHHCFAYRLEPDGKVFRSSDDGEPSGTAGKPILNQLLSKQVTNAAIVVVRYFGGVLLGVPGLIRSYKTAAALVLQTVPVVQKQIEVPVMVQFTYEKTGEVKKLVAAIGGHIFEQDIQLFPYVKAAIPVRRLEEFISKAKNIPEISVKNLVTL